MLRNLSVSIPFKRDMLSEHQFLHPQKRWWKRVSIPFKRDMLSELTVSYKLTAELMKFQFPSSGICFLNFDVGIGSGHLFGSVSIPFKRGYAF